MKNITLWITHFFSFYRINDKGTLEVMNQFHRNFKEGQSPSTALQEAQKRIIGVDYYTQKASANRGRVKVKSDKFKISLAHPYYWAFLKYSGTF